MSSLDDDYWNESVSNRFDFKDDTSSGSEALSLLTLGATNEKSGGLQNQKNILHRPPVPLKSVLPPDSLGLLKDAICPRIPSASRVQPDTVETELLKIQLGLKYDLNQFHSLESKIKLLDGAISSGDGNAIFAVSLFVQKTCSKSIVSRLFTERPQAVHSLRNYMSKRFQTNELTDLLMSANQGSEIGISQFEMIHRRNSSADSLINSLNRLLVNHFVSDPILSKDAKHLKSYKSLLEWQKAVNSYTEAPFKEKSPAVECLYQCMSSGDQTGKSLLDPDQFIKMMQISDRHVQWCKLNSFSRKAAWEDIYGAFIKTAYLLKKPVYNSLLDLEKVLWRLYDHQAPKETLEKFLNFLSDSRKALELASKFQCHHYVVNRLAVQRDREALVAYKATPGLQEEELFYLEQVLRSGTRWKN